MGWGSLSWHPGILCWAKLVLHDSRLTVLFPPFSALSTLSLALL